MSLHLPAARLLWTHVRRRPEEHAHGERWTGERRRWAEVFTARGVRLQHFRQAEVQQLYGAVRPQLDVRRLQIAVNDAPLVRRLEPFGDLSRDRDGFGDRYRAR